MTVSFYLILSLLTARVRECGLDPKGMSLIYILPLGSFCSLFPMFCSAIRPVSSPLLWLILVITQKYFRIFIESETVGGRVSSNPIRILTQSTWPYDQPAPKCRNDLFEAIVQHRTRHPDSPARR